MLLMVQAMGLKVGNPLRKLVLLKLADNASDNGECWPSYGHIADQCEISASSVRSHIKALAKDGFLTISPRFNDLGQQSNMYLLHLLKPMTAADTPLSANDTPHASSWHHPPSTADTAPPQELTPEPVIDPVIEPKEKDLGADALKKRTSSKATSAKVSELDFGRWPAAPSAQVLADWTAVRKGRKAPLTQTAVDRMAGDLAKAAAAGMSVDDCLSLCCVKGWVGFEFAWAVNCGAVVRAGAVGQAARHQPVAVSQHSSGEDDFADLGQAWGNVPDGFDGEGE
ncbi:helix-turn-helix domain-containing protein [Shewanella zhuhaiensis]